MADYTTLLITELKKKLMEARNDQAEILLTGFPGLSVEDTALRCARCSSFVRAMDLTLKFIDEAEKDIRGG